ncbi:MAG: glycoside hydrolase family 2 [Dysgonamonadaceae bacterium]|nr:glycoside hydrolase family 2 [Dysgonamonadaceae bacterium]
MFNDDFAPSEGYVNRVEQPLRKEICLNGRWDFQPVELQQGYSQGKGIAPDLPLPDNRRWAPTPIKIPSPWNINAFAYRNLEGPDHRNYPSYPKEWENVKMAWMRKTVTVPAGWENNRILLHFEAVAGQTQVYINGHKAAENFDLFLPFDVDITPYVKAGEPAEILVGVRSQSLFEDQSTKGRRIVPAGSMWGYHINGIWQDVYLLAIPTVSIRNVFIKPLVSQHRLELEITIENTGGKATEAILHGDVREWLNQAGTDILTAPLPRWELARTPALISPRVKLTIPQGTTKTTLSIPVHEAALALWTPEFPNLYGLTLHLSGVERKYLRTIDIKYERFGWREWTFEGGKQLLNGKVYPLKGDSWHFMGIPQMTRRYAYAWFTALKDANANAVRPHAQVYPRFYFDVADEMGICILAETANWASDGGPKLDSPLFWENSKDHLKRMVIRDRNHPSVFGWSVSNENKPVILHVFNKPEWMTQQKQAWADWLAIVRENDPTRPWVSSDGEDDGDGILPTTVGHYGDLNAIHRWRAIGKPWGIGEQGMAYYGTPEQVAKYNGERAYESQAGRMEGLAYEAYRLISQQRQNEASYISVFNLAWYALQPLPLGKRDLTTPPTLDDGIYFGEYREGQPGVQPERLGAYCSTFNPGYDPALPLYRPWAMFDAIKAANAGSRPAWSKWADVPEQPVTPAPVQPAKTYSSILFIGDNNSPVKRMFDNQQVAWVPKIKQASNALFIIDGKYKPSPADTALIRKSIDQGADCWLWSPQPETIDAYSAWLPEGIVLEKRKASSYLPVHKSWLKNTVNSDFYFSEIQTGDVSQYALSGELVNEGEILLSACTTDWRKWNKRPEELKTAAVLRSENEAHGAGAVFVKRATRTSTVYISTLDDFTTSEKGYRTLRKILSAAGIVTGDAPSTQSLLDANGNIPLSQLLVNLENNRKHYKLWLYSPRPLDDLLIEPDLPKLEIICNAPVEINLNGKRLNSLKNLPLKQGWNPLDIAFPDNRPQESIRLVSENHPEYIQQLQTSLFQ